MSEIKDLLSKGGVPLAALILSVATLIYTGQGLRTKADEKHLAILEQRITVLEREIAGCKVDRTDQSKELDQMHRERMRLMELALYRCTPPTPEPPGAVPGRNLAPLKPQYREERYPGDTSTEFGVPRELR